jgi:hypothetical protein
MKLTEFPEREIRQMKNYRWRRNELCSCIAVAILATGIAGALSREMPASLAVAFLLFVVTVLVGLTISNVRNELLQIPNGLPRPEDELPRKKLFGVHSRVDNRLLLGGSAKQKDERPAYWEFEDLPLEVEPGKTIVYLDNLEGEYLAKRKEEGVIPILSAQGRAELDAREAEHTEERNRFSEAKS